MLPAQISPNANPDGDEYTNRIEYVYDMHPANGFRTPEKRPLVSQAEVSGADINAVDATASLNPLASYYVCEVRIPKDPCGGVITVEGEPGLPIANSVPGVPYGLTTDDGDYVIQRYYFDIAVTTTLDLFIRIGVTIP